MNCNSNTAPLISTNTENCNLGCNIKDINIVCREIIIPSGQEILAIQGENNSNTRNFLIPKITEDGEDLSSKNFNIYAKNSNNVLITIPIENIENLDNYIKLTWKIDNSITETSGSITIQIEATSDNYIWKTYPASFIIANSL